MSVLAALLALPLAAQTATTIAAGTSYATENDGVVSGVRVGVRPDGSVWFLVPARDRIAVLRDGTTTQWAIRDDTHLGANPVDFEIDGDLDEESVFLPAETGFVQEKVVLERPPKLALGDFGVGRVEDIFAVDVTDAALPSRLHLFGAAQVGAVEGKVLGHERVGQ